MDTYVKYASPRVLLSFVRSFVIEIPPMTSPPTKHQTGWMKLTIWKYFNSNMVIDYPQDPKQEERSATIKI